MHADVLAPARRTTLEALAAFATNETEATRLRHLASPEGKAEYQTWVAVPSRSLLELLQAFPSVKPSLGARPRRDGQGYGTPGRFEKSMKHRLETLRRTGGSGREARSPDLTIMSRAL